MGGIAFFAVCVFLFVFVHLPGWILAIGIFMGALPMVKGLRRMVRHREYSRQKIRHADETRQRMTQRTALQLASQNSGMITAVSLALAANIAIEQADLFLQDMTLHGYAEMNVRDSGTIEYVLRGFM